MKIERHLLASILFSGYFDTLFVVRRLRVTCKYFFDLSMEFITYLDLASMKLSSHVIENIFRIAPQRLLYLNLCYNSDIDDSIIPYIKLLPKTLSALNLKGTAITDNAFAALSRLTSLTYLDVSKIRTDDAKAIDTRVAKLAKLTQLKW